MTAILQDPVPGIRPFDTNVLHSTSYDDLRSLDTTILRSTTPKPGSSYSHGGYGTHYSHSAPSSAPSSPLLTNATFSRQESYASTPASSISLDVRNFEDEEDDMAFPAFDGSSIYDKPRQVETQPGPQPNHNVQSEPSVDTQVSISDDVVSLTGGVNDDASIEPEPTRHVDYLAHEWKEEDIWSSWKYIIHRRKTINNSVRLENASWRTWMKAKNNLKTVSPETLNWLKDCDVTWLYGPLQTEARRHFTTSTSPLPNRLSHSSSFIAKKPCLKKKSASAVILERTRSQHSLLRRAGEIIRVQQSSPALGRPGFRRADSDFAVGRYSASSVANTPAEHDFGTLMGSRSSFIYPEVPTPLDGKHVEFNDVVRQVRAVESDDDDDEKGLQIEEVVEEEEDEDEDDDGGLMMAPTKLSRSSSRSTPRGSFGGDPKMIAPLPDSILKYRTDTPEPSEQPRPPTGLWPTGRHLSPSASSETLRPSRPSHNFLIDDDPEVSDEPWPQQVSHSISPYEPENSPGVGMRRTPSGMFMPYDEDEDEAAMNSTLFGQAMYAVNTFKDIAHVVWNVGWNRK